MNSDIEAAQAASEARREALKKKRKAWWAEKSAPLPQGVIDFIGRMVKEFDAELVGVEHPDGSRHRVPKELRRSP